MEEDDIAAAMGFSSFGGSKKRKYEHANPTPATAASSSGANSTQLGVRIANEEADLGCGSSAGNGMENPVESTENDPSRTMNTKGKPKQQAASSLADFLNRGQDLPDKPPSVPHVPPPRIEEDASPVMVSFGGKPISRAELNALRQGVRNQQGDLTYFLPSFLEDPWEKLEKNRR